MAFAGHYIKQWCPELSEVPAEWIHQPWLAPPEVLRAAGITVGAEYPAPVVSLDESRAALAHAYGVIQRCQAERTTSEPYRLPTVPVQVHSVQHDNAFRMYVFFS